MPKVGRPTAVIEMIVPVILILSKIISEPKGILVDVTGPPFNGHLRRKHPDAGAKA